MIYLGYFYILIGSIFLFIPLIYLEVGRPNDLIKAFLNLLIGIILIIQNKFFDNSFIAIYFLVTVFFTFGFGTYTSALPIVINNSASDSDTS